MSEIISKRSLNSKHFDNGDGTSTMKAHAGHIHYVDNGFKEIDWTLTATTGGWIMDKHSFHAFFPEYADEWCYFDDKFEKKNQKIEYRPICNHVQGVLLQNLEGVTNANCILYTDAYGEGKDLIYYFTRSTMQKVVRVREAFKGTEELRFAFEFKKPTDKKAYRGKPKDNKDNKDYEVLFNIPKKFDTDKHFLVGDDTNGDEWATYIKPFAVWDSSEDAIRTHIDVDFTLDDSKIIMEKIVPAEFIASSIGDIFTDTTTSYYTGAGDGHVANNGLDPNATSWANLRAASTLNSPNYTASGVVASAGHSSYPSYLIYRMFLPIDTSGLGASALITDATFYAVVTGANHYYTSSYDWVTLIVNTTQDSVTAVIAEDADQCGALNSPTEGNDAGDRLTVTTLAALDVVSITLNSTGITSISLDGYTKLGLRYGGEINNETPSTSHGAGNFNNGIRIYTSEEATAEYNPYLSVTYTVPVTDTGFLLMF